MGPYCTSYKWSYNPLYMAFKMGITGDISPLQVELWAPTEISGDRAHFVNRRIGICNSCVEDNSIGSRQKLY